MQTYQSTESPIMESTSGHGSAKRQYYSADEAMAFLEPRIRAMFK